ncbi:MAG: hypothetical protein KME08_00585 [Aphanothece sp. CMT-3BRIN-NPC111]|nr:hypothetical protein [Aphanothece sp. CMT-3BRIN-NPC111]
MTSNYLGVSVNPLLATIPTKEVQTYLTAVSSETLRKKKGSSDPVCDRCLLAFHSGGDSWRIREIALDYETHAFKWRPFGLGQLGTTKWEIIHPPTSSGYLWSTHKLSTEFRAVSPITLERKKSSSDPLYDGSKLAFYVGAENWLVGEVSIDYATGAIHWQLLRPSF